MELMKVSLFIVFAKGIVLFVIVLLEIIEHWRRENINGYLLPTKIYQQSLYFFTYHLSQVFESLFFSETISHVYVMSS